MTIFSNKEQMGRIANYLSAYMRIPYFQDDSIPGQIMEKIISLVHSAKQLGTYDYVDVCRQGDAGWQVKSTKEKTPVTWKRAKIANSDAMIEASEKNVDACQKLGDAIIDFCNNHARESLEKYELKEIGYARLIMFGDSQAIYFERLISNSCAPDIFKKTNYQWRWSAAKETLKKEQLPALHGFDVKTKKKIFAWHGRGENQLHFTGEADWWPEINFPREAGRVNFSADGHAIAFRLPSEKVSWDALVEFLNKSS